MPKADYLSCIHKHKNKGNIMGKGILLWLIGVPIPIIILLAILF